MMGADSMDWGGTLYTGGGTTVTVYERREKQYRRGNDSI